MLTRKRNLRKLADAARRRCLPKRQTLTLLLAWDAEGMSTTKIAANLNLLELPTLRGKVWTKNSVRRLLNMFPRDLNPRELGESSHTDEMLDMQPLNSDPERR
jgi:hypothetical protein